MGQKYHVVLSEGERRELEKFVHSKKSATQIRKRAAALLALDESGGKRPAATQKISEDIGVCVSSVREFRKRYDTLGFQSTLHGRASPRPTRVKITHEVGRQILALHNSAAPNGKRRWSQRMIASKLVEDGIVASISSETVRVFLKNAAGK